MFTLKKTISSLVVASTVLASSAVFAQYSEVRRLGTSEAVCLGGVKTAEQFQSWVAGNKATVSAILSQTVLNGVQDKVFAAITNGDFTETSYAPGTTFEFMSSKKKGVPTVLPNKIWAGSKAFEGYELYVSDAGAKYQIVIPKACCNFSLASIEEVAVEEPKAVTPFIAFFGGSESAHRYEPAWDMYKKDSSGIQSIRFGAKLLVSEGTYIVPSIGFLQRTSVNPNNVYPKNSAHVDIGFEKAINSKMFVGAGFGLWNANKQSTSFTKPSAFVTVGGDIQKNLEWFAEGRVIEDESAASSYGAGVRLKL